MRALLCAALLALSLCCSAGSPEKLEIELAPLAGADGSRSPVVAPGEAVDVFLRLPLRSGLRVEQADAVPGDAFRVSVDAAEASEVLALETVRPGTLAASLERFDGEPVRLRFENTSPVSQAFPAARVVGVRESTSPVVASGPAARKRPLNVLIYLVDTLRADRLSLYGYERETSPELEELARRGLLFSNAYAPSSHTVPSITALFASRQPSELSGRLAADGPALRTLAEVFREAGYQTAGFQTNRQLIAGKGYARGFDDYRVVRGAKAGSGRFDSHYAKADELHAAVEPWLRAHRDAPFFLYVQSMDTHYPYDPPAPFRDRYFSADSIPEGDRSITENLSEEQRQGLENFAEVTNPDRYDEAVAYADATIGRLLALLRELDLEQSTIVVVTSDHGEPLWQRGEFRHGYSLFEELVRVPLVVALPGGPRAERIEAIVSLVDLAPSLLDWVGIESPTSFRGQSWMRPGNALEPPSAEGELLRFRTHDVVGWFLREGPWKLLRDAEGTRLFHLPSDPGEERDVAGLHPVVRGHLEAQLMRRSPSLAGSAAAPTPLSEGLSPSERVELEEALEALGYVE